MQDALIKVVAMSSDVDENGHLDAGFVFKQLDLAAGIAVKELTGQRSVTIAMDNIHFKEPILVGDYLLCYAKITKLGNTSIQIELHIDIKRLDDKGFSFKEKVVSAQANFVSLDKEGKKISMQNFSLQNS